MTKPATERRRRVRDIVVGGAVAPPLTALALTRSERSGSRRGRRLAAVAAFAVAAGGMWLALQPVVARERPAPPVASTVAAPAAPAPTPPPRPADAPKRIPEWAWAMDTWHSTAPAERGPRPLAAPERLPGWYWEWRRWRLPLARERE